MNNSSEPSDQSGSNEMEALQARVERLEDMLLVLRASVRYHDEYRGLLLALNIYGETRHALTLVMGAIMTRALGESRSWNAARHPEAARRASFIFDDGPITRQDAVRAIAAVIDRDEATAEMVLTAHRDSGDYAGHRALGT